MIVYMIAYVIIGSCVIASENIITAISRGMKCLASNLVTIIIYYSQSLIFLELMIQLSKESPKHLFLQISWLFVTCWRVYNVLRMDNQTPFFHLFHGQKWSL